MSESKVTFKDFAAKIMGGDVPGAAGVLGTIAGLSNEDATGAATFFQTRLSEGPAFMMKAMGMRTVVEQKDRAGLVQLMAECFGLEGAPGEKAADTVLGHYPASSS